MRVPPLAETVAAFDARSASYDESRMHRVVAQEVVRLADPQQGQALLDLAGGTGLVARAALPRLGSAVVLDASPGMLREARRQEPRLLLVRADANRVPLRDDSVDLVTCVTALHLLAEPERALREAGRTCRGDGRVVFTTWGAGGWSTGRTFRAAAAQEGVTVPDPTTEHGTPQAATALAERGGLAVEHLEELRCTEPLPPQVWQRVAGSLPARSTPGATTDAVRRRFEQQLGDEVEHVLLLLRCRPQTSMPRR